MMNKKDIIALLQKMETLKEKTLKLQKLIDNAPIIKQRGFEYIMLKKESL